MSGAFKLWSDLLGTLNSNKTFLPTLLHQLLENLSSSANTDLNDAHIEALMLWILHLVMDSNDKSATYAARTDIMKWCCLHPGYWTLKLGRELLGRCKDEEFNEQWADLLEASRLVEGGEVDVDTDQMADMSMEVDDPIEGRFHDSGLGTEDEGASRPGWRRAVVPPNAPVGVVMA
jgi:ribosomal biogenesis protein LAS1